MSADVTIRKVKGGSIFMEPCPLCHKLDDLQFAHGTITCLCGISYKHGNAADTVIGWNKQRRTMEAPRIVICDKRETCVHRNPEEDCDAAYNHEESGECGKCTLDDTARCIEAVE